MSQFPRQHQWQQIMEKSAQMLLCSRDEEWETLVDLEKERRQLMEIFFASQVSQQEATMIENDIHTIIKQDKEVMERCSQQRDKVKKLLSGMAQGQKANNAYTQTSSL